MKTQNLRCPNCGEYSFSVSYMPSCASEILSLVLIIPTFGISMFIQKDRVDARRLNAQPGDKLYCLNCGYACLYEPNGKDLEEPPLPKFRG